MPLGGQERIEQVFHLAGFRKSPCGFLRVQKLLIEVNLKNPVPTLDQLWLDLESLLNLVRQTGG